MRKNLNRILFVFLITTMIFPMLSVVAQVEPAQAPRRFRFGIPGTPADHWDQAITPGWSVTDLWYAPFCTQSLVAVNDEFDKGIADDVPASELWLPGLATSWEIEEWWPEEMNSYPDTPFINKGGVKSISFTLRENVKFHDGSDWNATVAKWNIDRLFIITGNLTGRGDTRNLYTFWRRVWEWEYFFTPSWNLSSYKGVYGWYDTWSNPGYAPFQMYPIVNHVEIVDNAASGGKIKVVFNDWNSDIITNWGPLRYISMETYADYWDRGIYGHDPSDPIPHMVGTGPYIYEGHNEAAGGGSMRKNENYWNATELEDAGWFDADYIDIISFPPDDLGIESRNTALVTHSIDATYDNFFSPVNYEDVTSISNIEYIQRRKSEYITSITLNCIGDTWWSIDWVASTNNVTGYPGGNYATGVPKALRKAISYAFDYDAFITGAYNGRAVRPTVVGVDSIYHNDSIGIATYDLTIARNTILTDPIYGPIAASRLLTVNSSDIAWQNVANTNPIFLFDLYWDQKNLFLKSVFQSSLAKIGIALTNPNNEDGFHQLTTNMWDKVGAYWLPGTSGFPVYGAHGFTMDWNYPRDVPEGYLKSNYGDMNQGRWRDYYLAYYGLGGDISKEFWLDPGFWWYAWFNLAFTYSEDVDYWIGRMFMSNVTDRATWISKVVDFEQNDQYAHLYVSQTDEGIPVWKDWEASMFYGDINWALLRYVGLPSGYEEIPGFTTAFIVGSMFVTMVGIIVVMQKKRK